MTASWVGTGWVLNAGGVITRTIKGAPDEGSKNISDGPKGYYKDYGLTNFPKLDMVSNAASLIRKFIDNNIDKNGVDAEPDIYTINVDGFVGKFVFDEKRNVRFLTQTDVKVAVDYSAGEFQKWTATAPNGVQYIFGENGAKDINMIRSASNPDARAPMSWYLTKIIYPNSTDTLTLTYASEGYAYNSLQSEFTTADDSASLAAKVPDGGYLTYSLLGVMPQSIQSKNIEIDFSAYTGRKDVIGLGHALDLIAVLSKNPRQLIDKIELSYSYFKSPIDGSLELGKTDSTDTYRLKLSSVRKGLETTAQQQPSYTFDYYEDTALPRRGSYDVDHWGYANGYGGHNNRFTPNTKSDLKITGLTVTPPTGGQYREPCFSYTKAFSIKKITDPAGLSTLFEFEPNSITKDTIGGGIRIKRITVEDPITKQKQIKRFDYSATATRSTGVLFRKAGYWTEILSEYKPISSTTYAGDNASDRDLSVGTFCKYAQSPLPLQDYQGYVVGYSQVKELSGENGENGYNIYTYQTKPRPTATTRLQVSNYATSGIPNSKWNDIAPENLSYTDASKRGKRYPFEPLQTDLFNGLLTKQETFNKNGKLLQSTAYTYNDSYTENNWIRGFMANRLTYKGSNVYPFTYYKYRTGLARLLSQKTIIVDSITSKNINTETKYVYESANHLQPTRQIIMGSDGDTIEKVIRYSFDFDNGAIAGGVITEMKNQNILTPLRVETWNGDLLTNFNSTEYAKNTVGGKTTIVPIKTYAIENEKLLSSTDVGFNKSFNPTVPNLNGSSSTIKPQSFYSYNDAGLIKQQGKIGDAPVSYIWDYQNTLPIAIAGNAAPEDIAYTSFEADGTGNWVIAGADRNTTISVTGIQSYDLSKGNISKTGLSNTKTYWLGYWAKTDASISVTNTAQTIQGITKNGWTLWKKKINSTTSITISGTGSIDELCLYPNGSQIISYTYTPNKSISSKSDGVHILFYAYDELNRLSNLRDENKNIIQQYCYNYAGKPINCDGIAFKNAAISKVFTRNDCPGIGYIPSSVTYSIPAGKYVTIISQIDADAKAKADMDNNGQAYANTNGTCSTVYTKLSYENLTHYANKTKGDVVVRFYQDAACTRPLNVTDNLTIAFHEERVCDGETPSPENFEKYCKGSYAYLATNVTFHAKYGPFGVVDECFWDYYLDQGVGYTIVH